MEWKYYLIGMGIFVLGVLLIASIGTMYKEQLEEENGSINNLNDVYNFIESCNNKPFLNCDELLRRQLLKSEGSG